MKYIKLYENYGIELDLANYENVVNWCIENIDEFEEDRDRYDSRIQDYMDRYSMYSMDDDIEIYRMVVLDSLDDLDINKVGIYWSFETTGVGDYGGYNSNYKKPTTKNKFTLTGVIKASSIDWEHGFTSYMYYGDDQWECAVKRGESVIITEVNGELIHNPIKGII